MAVVRNIAFYLAATMLSRGMSSLRTFIVARMLGPENFGVWITLVLIYSYQGILTLGTSEALIKEVPYSLGRQDYPRARRIESNILGTVIFSIICLLALMPALPLVLRFTSWTVKPAVAMIALLTMSSSCWSYFFYYRFAAYGDFKMSGLMDLIRQLAGLVFVAGMGWTWGLWGAMAGYLVHELIMSLVTTFFSFRAHGRVGVSFQRDAMAEAVRIGFPITLIWWTFMLVLGVDRMVLGMMLGSLAVGHYGLGMAMANIFGLVPMVVGRVLYPNVNKHVGQELGSEAMKRLVIMPTLALGALLVNLQVVMLVASPLLYNVLLPKYRPGLWAGEILIVGSYFGSLVRNGANYLIATNLTRPFMAFILLTLAFAVLADVTLVKAGWGIAGVSVGTTLAGLLLNTLVWRRTLICLGCKPRESWTYMLHLNLPGIFLTAALLSLRILFPPSFQEFNMTTLFLGVLLLILINGALYRIPMFRKEMAGWKKELARLPRMIGMARITRKTI